MEGRGLKVPRQLPRRVCACARVCDCVRACACVWECARTRTHKGEREEWEGGGEWKMKEEVKGKWRALR